MYEDNFTTRVSTPYNKQSKKMAIEREIVTNITNSKTNKVLQISFTMNISNEECTSSQTWASHTVIET